MQCNHKPLLAAMSGGAHQFIIPVYQRNYDWNLEQCKILLDDIENIMKYKKEYHFLGSFVVNGKYLIDGQQRATTVFLLLWVIYNLYNDDICKEKIYNNYIMDVYANGGAKTQKQLRLQLIDTDQKALWALISSNNLPITNSRITENYQFLYDRINKWVNEKNYSLDDIFSTLGKLKVVIIELDNNDDAQAIFESINSTGLPLTEADKIRNFLLMNAEPETQEKWYNDYWHRIEENTQFRNTYTVPEFILDYLTMMDGRKIKKDHLFRAFKSYVETNYYPKEDILKDLLEYSNHYKLLLIDKEKVEPLERCLFRLNRLKSTIIRPFGMQVLKKYEEKEIGQKELKEIFDYIESYLFRRLVCNLKRNKVTTFFYSLSKQIEADESELSYLEKFKQQLLNADDNVRFPTDEEFKTAFQKCQVYKLESNQRKYVLERLENGDTRSPALLWDLMDGTRNINNITIEHIMPQKLTEEWINDLGENAEKIHKKWLHLPANLTITAYNPMLATKPFLEKRDTPNGGFRASHYHLNQWIGKQTKWTEKELQARSEHLAEEAVGIWRYPKLQINKLNRSTTKTQPKLLTTTNIEKQNLEYDYNFTKYKIRIHSFTFQGKTKNVNTWIEFYIDVIKQLYSINPEKLSGTNTWCISNDPNRFKDPENIKNQLFLKKGINNKNKIKVLKELLKCFDIKDPEALTITFEKAEK